MLQGIEKKTAKLKGCEKAVVARHEAGHAVVGTAVANLISGQPRVEVITVLLSNLTNKHVMNLGNHKYLVDVKQT